MSSEVVLSELREALAAYPLETPEQSETIVAAAREYAPLVQSVVTFAINTGNRINGLVLHWSDDT